MSTDSLANIIPFIKDSLESQQHRFDRIWSDWGFRQTENIDYFRDVKNNSLYLYLCEHEVVVIFMPASTHLKDIAYHDILDKLSLRDNFLMIIIGKSIDKYSYFPAEGRPICRIPYNIFIAPPVHQCITVRVEDSSDGDGCKYVRSSLCDILTFRTLLNNISSIPSTVVGEKQTFHLITEINLLAPCMSGISHSIKQWIS